MSDREKRRIGFRASARVFAVAMSIVMLLGTVSFALASDGTSDLPENGSRGGA